MKSRENNLYAKMFVSRREINVTRIEAINNARVINADLYR